MANGFFVIMLYKKLSASVRFFSFFIFTLYPTKWAKIIFANWFLADRNYSFAKTDEILSLIYYATFKRNCLYGKYLVS